MTSLNSTEGIESGSKYLDIFMAVKRSQVQVGVNHLGQLQAVPRKGFVSAVCDTLYTIKLSLCTHTADPDPFRGTHCGTLFQVSC